MAAALLVCAGGTAAQLQLAIRSVGHAGDIRDATYVTSPPGDLSRIFVTEKAGRIKAVRDGVVLAAPALDITGLVSSIGEGGLLGMAFHPRFASSGFVFICYTGLGPAGGGAHIVRYHTDPASPETFDPSSATEVLRIVRSAGANHQGGWIGFGPDGLLYITSGEGGNSTLSQNLGSLLGKLLRIDVDGDDFPSDPFANYAIPPGNPLIGVPGAAPEIWAYGLRNPWRASFDRLTGDFWVTDVGQDRAGEVNLEPAGAPGAARNYGWPCMDGSVCYTPGAAACTCGSPALTAPIYDYGRPGIATIGGFVYRGAAIAGLYGAYLFGDLDRHVWSMRYENGSITEFTAHPEIPLGISMNSFGQDAAGELYICPPQLGLFKIVPVCEANCDGSWVWPVLNVNDFVCFLNRFAAGDTRANCDHSTTPPVLNIADFACYQARFAAGCPE